MPYDPKQPLQYVENSKSYMLERLYTREKESPRRQTLDLQATVPVKVSAYPVEHENASESVWEVIVEGRATDAKGKQHPDELAYTVTLVFVDQMWKVSGLIAEAGGVD